ncbi:Proprotein convertase subtilisin/kexin type 7 [Mactra antiquata]
MTVLALCIVYMLSGGIQDKKKKKISLPNHSTNFNNTLIWAVHIQSSYTGNTKERSVDDIAFEVGLINLGQIGHLRDHYLFSHNIKDISSGKRHVSLLHEFHTKTYRWNEIHDKIIAIEDKLENHKYIIYYSHQRTISRGKRSFFPTPPIMNFIDPYYRQQWHLNNNIIIGMDVNVTGVWIHNITGRGVTVAVVDDGLEWNNPDLYDNYNKAGSWDFNDNDDDPMPDHTNEKNHHGTRCAGEISAIPNNVCGVGVAYGAQISGLRLLDGPLFDSLEAEAFTKHYQINDIYSCSWGPDDDGKTVDGPHILASAGLKHGIDFGRHGYGNIYVVASGNGGHVGDNCNYDGYANSLYTVTIGAVDETGHMPFYSEECASMLAVTFSSGSNSRTRDIVTTDWTSRLGTSRSGCTEHHTGTSAAAPIAAGLIALMLEAQPCLTWRDVQYLIVITALKVDIDIAHWQKNGAGLWHSHKHGFGLMSAWRLVNAAKVWDQVPWLTAVQYKEDNVDLSITKGSKNPLILLHTVTEYDVNSYDLYIMETVQVTLTLTHPCRGHLDIRLKSPSGTESVIGASRPNDNSSAGFDKWTFSTVRCWGESAIGEWKLIITDTDDSPRYGEGVLKSWALKLYGTPLTPKQFKHRKKLVTDALHGKFLNRTSKCYPPPVTSKPDVIMSVKTLKIIVMFGCLCFIFALYETFEYLVCYGDEKKEQRRTMKLLKRAYQLARQHVYGEGRQSNESGNQSEETSALMNENIPMETYSDSGETSVNYRDFPCDSSSNNEIVPNESDLQGQQSFGAFARSTEEVGYNTENKVDVVKNNHNKCSKASSNLQNGQNTLVNGEGHCEGHNGRQVQGHHDESPSQGHSLRDKLKAIGSNLNIISDNNKTGYSLLPNDSDESETEF